MALPMPAICKSLLLIAITIGGAIKLSNAQGKILTNFSIDTLFIALNLE